MPRLHMLKNAHCFLLLSLFASSLAYAAEPYRKPHYRWNTKLHSSMTSAKQELINYYTEQYGLGCGTVNWVFKGVESYYNSAYWEAQHLGLPTCNKAGYHTLVASCGNGVGTKANSQIAWCASPCPENEYLAQGSTTASPVCKPIPVTAIPPEEADPNQGASCGPMSGNPINTATGNKYQQEADFLSGNPIPFFRSYNSTSGNLDVGLGKGWRHNWQTRIVPIYASLGPKPSDVAPNFEWPGENGKTGLVSHYRIERSDGATIIMRSDGELPDPFNRHQLSVLWQGDGFVFTTREGVEQYNANGNLVSIRYYAGRTYNLSYQSGRLHQVSQTGSSASLTFKYDTNGRLAGVETTGGRSVNYGYDANGQLISATYADNTQRQYLYDDAQSPGLLSGIIDESQKRFASWSYDAKGRAVSSEHANGVDRVSLVYGQDAEGSWTEETSPLGAVRRYRFKQLGASFLNEGNSQPGGAGCLASNSRLKYDDRGNVIETTDFNGSVTRYEYDDQNLEKKRTIAIGTKDEQIVLTRWDDRFKLLHETKVSQQSTIQFYYNNYGSLVSKRVIHAPSNTSFSWEWDYDNFNRVISTKDELKRSVRYLYDNKGNLSSRSHHDGTATLYTEYNGDGQPLSITRPDGVIVTLRYDLRGRLIEQQTGTLKTAYRYTPTGLLERVTTPDGKQLSYAYDDAHRLIEVRDNQGNRISYQRDPMGNVLREDVHDASGALGALRIHIDADRKQLANPIPQAS